MATSGIYPVSTPHLSDDEVARLASLPASAQQSRKATHAELHAAIVALAQENRYTLELEMIGTGFMALIASDLRVVANQRGGGEETFYCQGERSDLLRQLAEQLARTCGPQIVLPSNGDEGLLVIAS